MRVLRSLGQTHALSNALKKLENIGYAVLLYLLICVTNYRLELEFRSCNFQKIVNKMFNLNIKNIFPYNYTIEH